MAFDYSWFKSTGVRAAQHAASSVLSALTGNAINVFHLDWVDLSGLGLGAALVSVLGSVVAYNLPGSTDEPEAEASAGKHEA